MYSYNKGSTSVFSSYGVHCCTRVYDTFLMAHEHNVRCELSSFNGRVWSANVAYTSAFPRGEIYATTALVSLQLLVVLSSSICVTLVSDILLTIIQMYHSFA